MKEGENPTILTFAESAKRDAKRAGFVVVPPFRASLASLRPAGYRLSYTAYPGEEVMSRLSRPTEMLINPDRGEFYLRNSNNLGIDAQVARVKEYDEAMKKKLGGGIDFIVGEAPDYAGVAAYYFDVRGWRLHGYRYRFRYTSTTTYITETRIATIGEFRAYSLNISSADRNHGSLDCWVAPLGVPAGSA